MAKRKFVVHESFSTRKKVFRIYINKPYTYFLTHHSQDITNAICYYVTRAFGALQNLITFFSEILVLVLLMGLMIKVNAAVTLVVFAISGGFLLIMRKPLKSKLETLGQQICETHDRMTKSVSQSINGIREIKLLQLEKALCKDEILELYLNIIYYGMGQYGMLKDARVVYGEDLACVIPCIYSARSLYCIPKCLYHYCYNRASATRGTLAYPWEDPKTIAAHLRKQLDLSSYDFEMQLKRRIAHLLFFIAALQFRRKERYGTIKQEILASISSGYYREAIEQAVFRGSIQGCVVTATLKYHLIWPIWLYEKRNRGR